MIRTKAMRRPTQTGFTYLWLLFLLAIGAAGTAAMGELWTVQSQRSKERELAFRGAAIVAALESYRDASPAGAYCAPQRVEELLEDSRTLPMRRHLRMPYRDPFSATGDWEWIRDSQQRLVGVMSNPPAQPLVTRKATGAGSSKVKPGQYQVSAPTTKLRCLTPPPTAIKQLETSGS